MKVRTHIIVALIFLSLFGCKRESAPKEEVWIDVSLTLNDELKAQLNAPQFALTPTSSAMVTAIRGDIESITNHSTMEPLGIGMLDMATNSITLSLPLRQEIRLVKSGFVADLTLEDALLQTHSDTIGLSEPFYLEVDSTSMSITIVNYSAPKLESSNPSAQAINISPHADLSLTFNNPMDLSTLEGMTSGTDCTGPVQLSGDNFASCLPFNAAPTASADLMTLTYPLSSSLQGLTPYSLFIDGEILDLMGNKMGNDTQIDFTTGEATIPGSAVMGINGGAVATGLSTVVLSLGAVDDNAVTAYCASEDPTTPILNSSCWVAVVDSGAGYSGTVNFTLSAGEELKTIYVWFRDALGNMSVRISGSIYYDLSAPTSPSVIIDAGNTTVCDDQVTLSLSASDLSGVTHYFVSESATTPLAGDVGWVVMNASTPFTLTTGVGTKTVYAWFKDVLGNVSAQASDTIQQKLANASLDTSFNTLGWISDDQGFADVAFDLEIDGTGGIWLSGRVNDGTNNNIALWSFSDAGALTAGYPKTLVNNSGSDEGRKIRWNGLGDLTISGVFTHATSGVDMALWNFDGTTLSLIAQDDGFLANQVDYGFGHAVDSANNLVVGGFATNASALKNYAVWRFDSAGTIDPTFNGTGVLMGIVDTATPAYTQTQFYDLEIDANGNYVVVGGTYHGTNLNWDMVICVLSSFDGLPLASFNGGNCFISVDPAGGAGNDLGIDVEIDASGNLVVAGYAANASGNLQSMVWRFLPNGTLDTGFNGTGIFTQDLAVGADDRMDKLAIDDGGNIYVVGYLFNAVDFDSVMFRLTSVGVLDTRFNGGAVYSTLKDTLSIGGNDYFRNIEIDSQGRVLLVGSGINATADEDMILFRLK